MRLKKRVLASSRRTHASFCFQAEDGIRDLTVTGVQTCALPILLMFYHGLIAFDHVQHRLWIVRNVFTAGHGSLRAKYDEIGRASCRERVQISVVAVSLKNNASIMEDAALSTTQRGSGTVRQLLL